MSSNEFDPPKKKKPNEQGLMMAFLGVGMSIAVEIAVSTCVGWWLGTWVDTKMHWEPYGMFAGVVIFLSASMTHAVIVLNHLNKRMNGD
ncbi:MAG: AtpZ/AtpI family protein [Bdellovibrionota bacterium]